MIERRGRPKEPEHLPALRKFTRVYEDDEVIETWTFDIDKFDKGPISVDIKYKPGIEKQIKERVKENKQIKQTARQMKKIKDSTDRRGRRKI